MTFDNLWKAFVLLPGTEWPRLALTAWEAVLGLIVFWAARRIRNGWFALALGFLCAFTAHEVAFRAWVRHVALIADADDGDVVGSAPKAVLTLERWIGPVR